MHRTFAILVLTLLAISSLSAAQPDVAQPEGATLVPIGPGYARTGVNAVIFRRNSVVTHREAQYAAYYDPEGRVVLAKRTLVPTNGESEPRSTAATCAMHTTASLLSWTATAICTWRGTTTATRYATAAASSRARWS